MLSDRSRPVIEATLPAVAAHIGEIARRSYAHVRGENPQLMDGVFNRGNHAEGTQQVALAGPVAVLAGSLNADEQEASVALRRQVLGDVATLPKASAHLWYERGAGSAQPAGGVHEGLLDLDDVQLPAGAVYHRCGPTPFLRAVRGSLLERGVPARDVHHEVFGPALWQADVSTQPSRGAEELAAAWQPA